MPTDTLGELSSTRLPFSEQLLRLNRLRKHLTSVLYRYSLEPQTEEAFRQREDLREELNALEAKCSYFAGLLRRGGGVLENLKKDLANLFYEVNRLETKVSKYRDRC
jgi:chromosome segregation ATPase